MKPIIFIPVDVLSSNISSDAKLLYGIIKSHEALGLDVDVYNISYIKDIDACLGEIKSMSKDVDIKAKPKVLTKKKEEDWNDPSIGVWVGPNNRKSFRLEGVYLQSFNALYKKYNNLNGKRNAAWAFYQTIKLELDNLPSANQQGGFMQKVLVAASKAAITNAESKASGSTPQFLQGWISGRRWEDYE